MNELSSRILPAIVLSAAMTSCAVAPDKNYIGKSYPSTTEVEVFLDWNDLPQPYETMGCIVIDGIGALGSSADTPARAQQQIERIARQKGADAVVIGPAAMRLRPAASPAHPSVAADGTETPGPASGCEYNRQLAAAFIKYKAER